jgi:transcriptional regulator with XRE-family HTH domain
MADSVHINSASIVAARLKEARLRSGLSTRAVAAEVAKRFPNTPLSHSSIANWEKAGASSPPISGIAMLAEVYERDVAWFLEPSQPLRGVRYRYLSSRVLVRERHQYETEAQHWLEGYVKLEQRLRERLNGDYDILTSWRTLDPPDLAKAVRELWEYRDGDPIRSVIEIMEGFGIRVIELRSAFRIDGLAAQFGNEYAVVLNPSMFSTGIATVLARQPRPWTTGPSSSPAAC